MLSLTFVNILLVSIAIIRYIEDEMMPELCDWIIKLGDKVKILM